MKKKQTKTPQNRCLDVYCRIEYYFAYVDQYVNFTC